MRNYLELTPVQQKQADEILEEIRNLEMQNIKTLQKNMDEVQTELKKTQQSQKFQQAYENTDELSGSIVNIQE